MAFESLSARLATLPQVLCGPLLRQVTPRAVTVWVVTQTAAKVTLKVHEIRGGTSTLVPPAAQRSTTAIGKNLHMVAVTARWPDVKLTEDSIYSYNLEFDFPAPIGLKTFQEATLASVDMHEFAYPGFTLPTFVLPTKNLQRLRLIQGSCRKPNGGESDRKKLPANGSTDMLGVLDDLIEAKADQPLDRPHQLLLTGDQIYADEVADVLLKLITDAGDVLLGWEEKLPNFGGVPPLAAKSLKPAERVAIIEAAQFTTSDRRSHLMSLGEYLSMYLFAWSPVLWPNELPDLIDVPLPADLFRFADAQKEQRLEVQSYASTLGKVRRALANIPSYMGFDDHEVTDDWNITREWCENVYGNPLGMRIIQNGLLAYALCQGWGNVPEQFEDHPASPAGLKLLGKLGGGNETTYDARSKDIQKILGLQDKAALAAHATGEVMYSVQHVGGATVRIRDVSVNDGTLYYDYTVEGPSHQVIVTDTRTWRSWPRTGAVEHPDLLSASEISRQVAQAPRLGERVQIVVVSTNMPNTPPMRSAEELLSISDAQVYGHDLYDAWEFPSRAFDQMIAELADRMPLDGLTPPANTGAVVILSGDVHSTYANRLTFWRRKRHSDPPSSPRPAKVVFAQLVASALKNEATDTIGQHEHGYGYSPKWYTAGFLPDQIPEGVYGWAFKPSNTQGLRVGTQLISQTLGGPPVIPFPVFASVNTPSIHRKKLVYKGLRVSAVTALAIPPDYEYRMEQIHADSVGQSAPLVPSIPPVSSSTLADARKTSLESFNKATAAYRDYRRRAGRGKHIVGRNNICEITFTWRTGENKAVHHTALWFEPKATSISWARFTVSLALNDPTLKPIPL